MQSSTTNVAYWARVLPRLDKFLRRQYFARLTDFYNYYITTVNLNWLSTKPKQLFIKNYFYKRSKLKSYINLEPDPWPSIMYTIVLNATFINGASQSPTRLPFKRYFSYIHRHFLSKPKIVAHLSYSQTRGFY